MAHQFDVEGWADFDGERHTGKPSDVDDTMGIFVHVTDTVTGDNHYFWAWVPGLVFDSWDEWFEHIQNLMSVHFGAL